MILRQRQVGALSRALGHFVWLKSATDGWQPVEGTNATALPGSDIDVHLSKRAMRLDEQQKKTIDIYRLTAAIPLDGETSRDTQGSFSAYLSELRDWQAVLECPGIRSRWNYFLESSSSLEMLDAHTSITRSVLRKPVTGCSREFAHERDLLMVETSLVDPTTAIYVATSLPTSHDDPAYLRERLGFKRVRSDLWAWCVEIATPMAVAPELMLRQTQQGGRRSSRKPTVCVQVTCFLHLELGSWRSYDHEACRAAANLIPALVAHLRLHGAPPRLARVGPAIAVERRDWVRPADSDDDPRPIWEIACSLADSAVQADSEQPIVARILAMQASSGTGEQALTSYLSSSLQRKQTESAAALGTHGGGIVRDGEAVVVAATRAWVGNGIVEFVVDASRWASEGHAVEITACVDGLAGAGLRESILRAQLAAPELFTPTQRVLLDTAQSETELAALLVRCFSIASLKSGRKRYLVRVVVPPPVLQIDDDDDENDDENNGTGNEGTGGDGLSMTTSAGGGPSAERERVRGIRVTVRRGKICDADSGLSVSSLSAKSAAAAAAPVLVNGRTAEVVQFSLDPTEHQPPALPRLAIPQQLMSSALLFTRSAETSPRLATQSLDHSEQRPASIAGVGVNGQHRRPASLHSQRMHTPADPQRNGQRAKQQRLLSQQQQDGSEYGGETTPTFTGLLESEALDVPLARLQSIQQLEADGWTPLGGGSGGPAGNKLARNDASIGKTDGHYVVRLETTLEGWTVFDVLGVIQQMHKTGLWDSLATVKHESPNASTIRCVAKGNWAAQARSTVVCRVWTTDGRRRIEMAESTIADHAKDKEEDKEKEEGGNGGEVVAVDADVRLAAWVLETAAVDDAEAGDGRARSASVATMLTDLAADVEAANQRRRQHAVRATRYLQYNPGGWLDSSDDSIGAPLRKLGAAALSKDAVLADISLVRKALDSVGALPGLVWARNIHLVQTQYLDGNEGVAVRYRMSSADRHGVAAELRIEHRVWARHGGSGNSTSSTNTSNGGLAVVSVSVEPWGSGCAVACFVDPDADPHATRIRIRHPRDLLLPRIDALGTAWPTVTVRISRGAQKTDAQTQTSSASERPAWSVPPRVLVNGVGARVRYLRRSDSDDAALYARCASVAARDASRMLRDSDDAVIDDAPSTRDTASEAAQTDDGVVAAPKKSSGLAGVAVLGYSAPESATDAQTTLVSAEKFADLAARVFADARHDVGSDEARTRWHRLRGRRERRWEHRRTDATDVYERLIGDVHGEIPVVVAATVLQRTEIARVVQAVLQPWMHVEQALFGGRRTLETVAAGTTIEHVEMQTPVLCDRRDALTVRRVELAPFMPARQRLQTWQSGVWACGRRGDYGQPTLTVVEASVPQSQPLRSATRALVPLFGIRVEPIDGFERIASGSAALQQPACRLYVACCVDLAGSMPMAIRRAWSARVPELVVAQIRQLVAVGSVAMGPWLQAPMRASRAVPRGATGDRSHAVREVVSADIDGRRRQFVRSLDQRLVVGEQGGGGDYSVSVCLPQCLALISGNSPLAEALPVVADIHVPASCFPTGLSVCVQMSSGTLPPLVAPATQVPCGEWLSGALGDGGRQRLAVYVLGCDGDGDGDGALLVRVALVPCGDGIDVENDGVGSSDECTVTIGGLAASDAACSRPVLVNGQPMRVHQQAGDGRRRALQLVETSDGRELAACGRCGSVVCADDRAEDDFVAGDPDYLSDSLSADENSATPVRQRTPSLGSGGAAAVAGGNVGAGPLLPDALSLRSVDSALSQPEATLRQRRPQQQQQQLDEKEDGGAGAGDGMVKGGGPDKRGGGCGYMVSRRTAKALQAVLGVAVFMPVRRLVVAGWRPESVQQYLEAAASGGSARAAPAAVRKSTLCLALLMLIAAASVALGLRLAVIVYV
ncbi:hypothetical protein LPJ75_000973 [Coemansia sp. RSA 2598]|nr:hypothetical protein LPJ75_000973 [Coemansia sp. RSA 2598]